MNKKVILLVLVALLIFSFGCIGGQQTQEKQQTKEGNGQTAGGQQGAIGGQQEQKQEQKQESGPAKISEIFGGLISYECNIKSKDPSVPVSVKMYVKGEKLKSIMTVNAGGQTTTSEAVVPGDGYVYVRLATPINNCEWMKAEIKKGNPETNPSEALQQYEEATKWEYTCTVGTFGDDFFAKPAKACTTEEMMGSIPYK